MPYKFVAEEKPCSRISSRKVNFLLKTSILHFFEGLGAVHTVHIRLIGKPIVDFLLVIIELFSLGVMAEVLRVDIHWKSVFLKRWYQFRPKFHVSGFIAHQPLFLSES